MEIYYEGCWFAGFITSGYVDEIRLRGIVYVAEIDVFLQARPARRALLSGFEFIS